MAHSLLYLIFMRIPLACHMLSRIAKEIADGRPIWAMLTVNEYLTPQHPLRQALCIQALAVYHSQATEIPLNLAEQVLKGAVLGDFSEGDRNLLKEILRPTTPPVQSPPRHLRNTSYSASLQRLNSRHQQNRRRPAKGSRSMQRAGSCCSALRLT